MLEKHFVKGVTFKWIPPKEVMTPCDGQIVLSPQVILNPMIYSGMDTHLATFPAPNPAQLGLVMNQPIKFNWLVYAPGRTAKRLLSAGDTLTGFMSGCPIAVWQENGMRYVGHVGTIVGNDAVNQRVRRAFAAHMSPDAFGFNPAGAWSMAEIEAITHYAAPGSRDKILALVTSTGAFYSILMYQLPTNRGISHNWCVGGIKRVAPMNPGQLRTWLTS